MTGERGSMAQLFSMNVGNRVPIVEKLFSAEVTWEERSEWVERIRMGLRGNNFPRRVRGLFIGISAMYHAVKAAGCADRIISKGEVVTALAEKLKTLNLSDHRSVANLTLVKEV